MTIIEAIHDQEIFKSLFRDLSTWRAWIIALKAIFGLPLSDEELGLYRQCTGREKPPSKPFKEICLICGRRSGKSFIVSVIAVFLAIFKDYSRYLAPGERGSIMVLAVDKKQAGIILRYVKAILSLPIFRSYVERTVAEAIELSNRINIEVHACSYRTVRGYTIVAAIFEEVAFWRVEGANPDREVKGAVTPAMTTIPDSMQISISTPYSRQGLLYENYREYFGKEDEDVLVWKAPSIVMNPTLNEKEISKQRKKDPSAARAEFDGDFREDIEAFLPLEVIEAVVIRGRVELPRIDKFSYFAFTDPSGGGGDSFTLSIGHRENGKVIQDALRAARGDPHVIVKDYAELLGKYQIKEVTGDRYAGAWVSVAFEKEGISYKASEFNKSELYVEALPYITSGSVELLDSRELVTQLRLLERRRGSSGKDTVDHPATGGVQHDDLSNSTAGMIAVGNFEEAAPGLFFVKRGEERAELNPGVADTKMNRWLLGED